MKRYLITGASRGIGRAIACRLAAADTTLLLHGRDQAALAETCRLVEGRGAVAARLIYDLAETKDIEQLIGRVGHEPLDLLINNAGVAVVKPFAEVTLVEWQQSIAVNVTAPFLLIRHFAPLMQPGASVVNILSIAAKTAFPNWSVYCATKYALDGLSAAIREELRPHRVRMLNVYPAATDTEIWNAVPGDWPREQMISPMTVADAVLHAVTQPASVSIESITVSNTAGAL